MFVRQSTQNNKAKHKCATNFTEAEGIALHKPGACEAKQGNKTYLKHKCASNCTGAEGKALHKPDVCEAKHTKHKLLNKAKHKRVTNFTGVEGIALHKPGVCEANTQNKVTD